jgi:hypothetical protein
MHGERTILSARASYQSYELSCDDTAFGGRPRTGRQFEGGETRSEGWDNSRDPVGANVSGPADAVLPASQGPSRPRQRERDSVTKGLCRPVGGASEFFKPTKNQAPRDTDLSLRIARGTGTDIIPRPPESFDGKLARAGPSKRSFLWPTSTRQTLCHRRRPPAHRQQALNALRSSISTTVNCAGLTCAEPPRNRMASRYFLTKALPSGIPKPIVRGPIKSPARRAIGAGSSKSSTAARAVTS